MKTDASEQREKDFLKYQQENEQCTDKRNKNKVFTCPKCGNQLSIPISSIMAGVKFYCGSPNCPGYFEFADGSKT